jgi:transposase-like protein
MAKKKKTVKKSFTQEVKAETLRLIREDGYTLKQAAEYAGCSLAAIQQWKAAAKAGKIKIAANETVDEAETAEPAVKKAKKSKRRRKGAKTPTTVTAVAVKPTVMFDEFVQGFWSEYPEAMDIMRLPADITPKAVQYVNDVLRYAYDQFCGE